ncbi:MAG: cytochrome c oxidase subunit II [SAR202 cluster bacterium]|nr:cytochrome c oxidase subunit II [SAR202 cluster bacterium]
MERLAESVVDELNKAQGESQMGLLPFRRTGNVSEQSVSNTTKSIGRRSSLKNRSVIFGLLAALFLFAVGCSKDGMSPFDPMGPVAAKQLDLFNVLMWVMVIVFVLVEGVLLYAIIRYRKRPGQAKPPQTHGNTSLEITLTIIPTILVLGLAIWSVFTLFDLQDPPEGSPEALHVNVTGHQWWFEFEYPDAGNGKKIITANELRIPVDRPITLSLESDDVIHSFWVPKLAGKLDMIPTHTNEMWFQADSDKINDDLPVTLYGQCAELCGLSHALMKFQVTVMDQADFDSWAAAYGPPPTISARAKAGQAVFAANCTLCHTIDGPDDPVLSASRLTGFLTGGDITPVPAPNLTDLRTRHTLAAGLVDLSETNLLSWLHDPSEIKANNYMSQRAVMYKTETGTSNLTNEEIDALIGYLLDLQ